MSPLACIKGTENKYSLGQLQWNWLNLHANYNDLYTKIVRFRIQVHNKSSFQMTVESNYVIAIATLSDWRKRLAPVFLPMAIKTKTNRAM